MTVKGLFIGINYTGTKHALNGCINDATNNARNFKEMCQEAGYRDVQINLMTDKTEHKPNVREILEAMAWLVCDAKAGDLLFFHYSGHGSQMKDDNGDEDDGVDETIVALDGQIRDDTIRKVLGGAVPENCTLYAIFDCCHSGTIMDLRNVWDEDTAQFVTDTHREPTRGHVFMISGCLNVQTSADLPAGYKEDVKESVGALTNALLAEIRNGYSWEHLITEIRRELRNTRLQQIPQFETGRDENGHNMAFALLYPPDRRGELQEPPPGKKLPPVNNQRVSKIHSLPPGPYGIGTAAVMVYDAAQVLFGRGTTEVTAATCALCACIIAAFCGSKDNNNNREHDTQAHHAKSKWSQNAAQMGHFLTSLSHKVTKKNKSRSISASDSISESLSENNDHSESDQSSASHSNSSDPSISY